jgi:hypothetical protein
MLGIVSMRWDVQRGLGNGIGSRLAGKRVSPNTFPPSDNNNAGSAPPTSLCDPLVASFSLLTMTMPAPSYQQVFKTRWWPFSSFQPPSLLPSMMTPAQLHQRVFTTCWWPPPLFQQRRLIGGLLPSSNNNDSLVASFPLPTMTTHWWPFYFLYSTIIYSLFSFFYYESQLV